MNSKKFLKILEIILAIGKPLFYLYKFLFFYPKEKNPKQAKLITFSPLPSPLLSPTGNYMNGESKRGGAWGFKLEVLPKLADTKTLDNKSTLLHYLVLFCEKKFPDLIDFFMEMPNLETGARGVWREERDLFLLCFVFFFLFLLFSSF